jgi:PAS domain S-box-containing protein
VKHGMPEKETGRSESTEHQVRQSEFRYHSFFDNSPVALWEEDLSLIKEKLEFLKKSGVTDLDRYFTENPAETLGFYNLIKVLDVNYAAIRLFRFKDKDDFIHNLHKTFKHESLFFFKRQLISMLESAGTVEAETVRYTTEGDKIFLQIRCSVAPGNDNDLSRNFITAINITNQKIAEEALKHANEQLEQRVRERTAELEKEIEERKQAQEAAMESERRLRFVNESIPQMVWTAEPDGAMDYVNQRWYEYTGLSQEELEGWQWLEITHPEDREKTKAGWIRAVEGGKIWESEDRKKRFDGVYHWFLGRALPFRDQNGRISKWFCTCTDINVQKENEAKLARQKKELAEANEELARTNEELNNFAYTASHDLQEPLRMISSYTSLIERRYRDRLDQEGLEFFHFVLDGTKRMKILIEALLDHARLGIKELIPDKVDLNKVVETVKGNLRFSIDEKNARVIYDQLPVLEIDQTRMLQLFQNLIFNAIKYNTSEQPLITVSANRQEDKWLFSVKDNGIGIAREHFEKIFVIFHRLHSDSEHSGTGIGLATCKRIVQLYGGKIWVESELGKGSVFFFTLPAQ